MGSRLVGTGGKKNQEYTVMFGEIMLYLCCDWGREGGYEGLENAWIRVKPGWGIYVFQDPRMPWKGHWNMD